MANNIFSTLEGTNREVIGLLEDAILSLRNNDTNAVKIVFETAPGAFDKGYIDDKTASFFGFAFKRNGSKPKQQIQSVDNYHQAPASEKVETPVAYASVAGIRITKITERQCERYKSGVDFICACGFTTTTSTGFKKHFNRCTHPNKWDKVNNK